MKAIVFWKQFLKVNLFQRKLGVEDGKFKNGNVLENNFNISVGFNHGIVTRMVNGVNNV